MTNEWFDISCIDACDDGCPEWAEQEIEEAQDCCTLTEKSQICDFILDPCGQNPIAGWTEADILAWSTNIVNADTTGTKMKRITVEGEIPKPTANEQELPKGKTKIVDYTYNPVFTRKCITPAMNDMMRKIQKGNSNARIWFQTLGGGFYGGINGIALDKLYASPINGGGREDIRTWEIDLQYTVCVDPPRITSPFA